FLTCYGMAETTLMVTATRRGEPARTLSVDREALDVGSQVVPGEGRELVGCGAVDRSVTLRDPETGRPVGDDRVGEICVRGAHVARDVPKDAEGWFHTGDLGFVRDGQLFVVGRTDNRFKVRGRNLYSEDLE